ncbi:type 4a pilus biogenesis protein PilO [Candidatus Halobeggiatoa sp. HSG11]|nr:type 4a pilus biogenesis protein PilO [Candidatus Halobeggiatoa sp. HSG11]
MKMEEFKGLEPKNFGNWPIPIKGLIILILCAMAFLAGLWFDTKIQIENLTKTIEQEDELKSDFKSKQWKAATLPKLKKQLIQIESTLDEMLRKLPDKAQVDELIRDISQAVLASGLKQELFKPHSNKKEKQNIYEQLPIELKASGHYHAFGKFISGVAAMNRIVTLHNVKIKSNKKSDKEDDEHPLTLKMTAHIYRYLEAEEETETRKTKKGNKPKKKAKKNKH